MQDMSGRLQEDLEEDGAPTCPPPIPVIVVLPSNEVHCGWQESCAAWDTNFMGGAKYDWTEKLPGQSRTGDRSERLGEISGSSSGGSARGLPIMISAVVEVPFR